MTLADPLTTNVTIVSVVNGVEVEVKLPVCGKRVQASNSGVDDGGG